ncbi:hypothetical protein IFM89_030881 [Coptis chinensis]|uniref:NAC domain-containing protein n=1 Tax=Coptis chinensis TaxID=261450 RepID=A0A835IHQ1_9MAGN|nr:hypothetical protein IFM89_030881 [Coptis chinensis]
MHEFRLENLHMPPKEEWVLCRVFHKGKEDLSSKKCLEYDTDDAIIGENDGNLGLPDMFSGEGCGMDGRMLNITIAKGCVHLENAEFILSDDCFLLWHCALLLSDPSSVLSQAVNLKSSELLDHPSFEICNGVRQNALVEIFQILTMVCETHKLALAQTWVPCKHRRVLADGGGGVKKSCRSFDGSCMGQVCM